MMSASRELAEARAAGSSQPAPASEAQPGAEGGQEAGVSALRVARSPSWSSASPLGASITW